MHRFTPPFLFFLAMLLCSGCFYSREIAHIRTDVEDILDARFDQEVVVTVGPRAFRTISWIARRVPDVYAQMASDYVGEIDRVKVGVYTVRDRPTHRTLAMDKVPRFRRSGWEVAVRVEEDEDTVWVLYRERYGSIRDMLVLALNDDEFVIARVQGHLNELVQMAAQDAHFFLARHDHDE